MSEIRQILPGAKSMKQNFSTRVVTNASARRDLRIARRVRTPNELVVAAKVSYNAGYRRMDLLFRPIRWKRLQKPWGSMSRKKRACPAYACWAESRWARHCSRSNPGFRFGRSAEYRRPRQVFLVAFIIPAYEWDDFMGGPLRGLSVMLALNRLPSPYHPLFNAAEFSQRRNVRQVLLCLEADESALFRYGNSFPLESLHQSQSSRIIEFHCQCIQKIHCFAGTMAGCSPSRVLIPLSGCRQKYGRMAER